MEKTKKKKIKEKKKEKSLPADKKRARSFSSQPRERVHNMKVNSYICCALPLAPVEVRRIVRTE